MKKNKIRLKYVKTVRNFKNFEKLELLTDGKNRKQTKSHIEKIKESIERLGFLGSITVVETKAFGKKQLIIVDGQNRYSACMQLGVAITYEVHKVIEGDNALNITKLISTLNTTAKSWSPTNFLKAFVANKIPNYMKFDSIVMAHGFTITDLLHIYLGGGGTDENKSFKSGEMEFIDEEEADRLLKAMVVLKPCVPNLAMCRRVLPKIFRISGGDYMGLAKQIEKEAKVLKGMDMAFPSNQKEFEKTMKKQLVKFKKAKRNKAA